MVILQAFIDDSGSADNDPVFALGGFVAPVDRWNQFWSEWSTRLREPRRIQYCKMREAMGFKREFAGWNQRERDAKLIRLSSIIPDFVQFSVSASLTRIEYDAILKQHIDAQYQSPYFFLAIGIILRALAELRDTKDKKIDFIFDRQSNLEMRLQGIFCNRLKMLFPSLGNCFHLDDKEVLPLQAADMNAWITREYDGLIARPTVIAQYLSDVRPANVKIDRATFEKFIMAQSESPELQSAAIEGIASRLDPLHI
ncbi:MAG: DUF3800 domain-containing protein [Candidatus Acidiferrales bacterium]